MASSRRLRQFKTARYFVTASTRPGTDALHVTPPLNPAPCTTREPSVGMEAIRQWIRTRLNYLVRTSSSDLSDRDKLLRRLLLEYVNWERPEGWSPEETLRRSSSSTPWWSSDHKVFRQDGSKTTLSSPGSFASVSCPVTRGRCTATRRPCGNSSTPRALCFHVGEWIDIRT